MKKGAIYFVGVVLLGLSYALKPLVGDPTFFVGAITYLILLRLVAEKVGK